MKTNWVELTALLGLLATSSTGFAEKKKTEPAGKSPAASTAPATPAARHIKVGVTEAGFEPNEIEAKAGENLVLDITRVTDETCATAIVIPDQKLKQDLPLNKEVQVPVKAGKAGRIAFACPMNMVTGAIVVKD
jgi:plastocyanin domain-containing protein